jgi:hypothetical protein
MYELLMRLLGVRRYVRVTHEDGGSFITTPAEADEFLASQNAIERREYVAADEWLTRREFDALDEFVGF